MALKAIIFDVDGTLVDTNRVHVEAWRLAFQRHGFEVSTDRIAPEIGKGGDQLVPAILGEAADKEHGEALRHDDGQEFLQMATQQQITVFPCVRELMQALHERGLKVALATSGEKENLQATEKSAQFDLQGLADIVITSADVKQSKPAPDLVEVAVKKLGLAPAECVMVGDTPHDVEACQRAGVMCYGVLTGGHTKETLLKAGARLVWQDVADLLAHLDDALQPNA